MKRGASVITQGKCLVILQQEPVPHAQLGVSVLIGSQSVDRLQAAGSTTITTRYAHSRMLKLNWKLWCVRDREKDWRHQVQSYCITYKAVTPVLPTEFAWGPHLPHLVLPSNKTQPPVRSGRFWGPLRWYKMLYKHDSLILVFLNYKFNNCLIKLYNVKILEM